MLLFESVQCVVFGVCVCVCTPHSLDDDDDDDVCFESIIRSAPGGRFCFSPSCFTTAKFPCFQVNGKQASLIHPIHQGGEEVQVLK